MKQTIFAWNNHRLVVRYFDDEDKSGDAALAEFKLRNEVLTDDDDPRWQIVEGHLEVEVRTKARAS